MPIVDKTFRQDPRLSAIELRIQGNVVSVITRAMGLKQEKNILLSDIDPRVEISGKRFARLYAVQAAFAVALSYASLRMINRSEDFAFPALFLGICALFAGYLSIQGARRVEVVSFRNREGEILFELYAPKNSRIQYEEFKSALIEKVQGKIVSVRPTSTHSHLE